MKLMVQAVRGHLSLPEPINIVMCTVCGGIFSTQVYQPYLRLIATVFADYHVYHIENISIDIVCPCCRSESVMSFRIEPKNPVVSTEEIDNRFLTMPVGSTYLS